MQHQIPVVSLESALNVIFPANFKRPSVNQRGWNKSYAAKISDDRCAHLNLAQFVFLSPEFQKRGRHSAVGGRRKFQINEHNLATIFFEELAVLLLLSISLILGSNYENSPQKQLIT